ncbi:hypothetical protein FRC06_007730, partial [Ceratobasidium sp. 370]
MGALSDDDDNELDLEEDPLPPPRVQPQPSQSHINRAHAHHRGGATNDIVAFANACCEEFGLPDMLKNDALKCAQLPLQHLLIRTYTRVLSFGQHVKHSNVSAFLMSTEFKEHITRRLQCSILDPNLLFYVKGTTARFVKHMIANPGLYQISPAVQEHFMHSREYSAAVGDVFSNYRSELKRKTEKGSDEGLDIYSLCPTLVMRGFQLTDDHALRISFMRMYLDQYNMIVWAPKDKKKKTFWEWLDDKLAALYQLPEEAQVQKLQKNLRKDLKRYPIPARGMSMFPPVAHFPDWQADVSTTTLEMLDDFYTNSNLALTEIGSGGDNANGENAPGGEGSEDGQGGEGNQASERDEGSHGGDSGNWENDGRRDGNRGTSEQGEGNDGGNEG